MSVWAIWFILQPPGVQHPDFSPQAMRRADSVHFAWKVDYYMRIIPWNRPNPFLHHPQIQKCLGFTLKNGRVIFPKTMSYEQRAWRLKLLFNTFFFPSSILTRCRFIPERLLSYLQYGREFIPLNDSVKSSVLLHTLWFNAATGSGLVILKNVKRRWVMPWEKAWKAGYRSVFIGEIAENILPPDTFLGRLDKKGKVRLWSVLGPFEGGTIMGLPPEIACKVPPAKPLMLFAYIPFPAYPHKDLLGLPGAIRTTVAYWLEPAGEDTLVIRWCDYLEPLEIWISDTEKRVIRFESDTTKMSVVRAMVAELQRWVEKVRRGETLEPVKVPLPKEMGY